MVRLHIPERLDDRSLFLQSISIALVKGIQEVDTSEHSLADRARCHFRSDETTKRAAEQKYGCFLGIN